MRSWRPPSTAPAQMPHITMRSATANLVWGRRRHIGLKGLREFAPAHRITEVELPRRALSSHLPRDRGCVVKSHGVANDILDATGRDFGMKVRKDCLHVLEIEGFRVHSSKAIEKALRQALASAAFVIRVLR